MNIYQYNLLYVFFYIAQATSYGGTITVGHDAEKVSTMSPVKSRKIKVKFTADTAASMQWNFKPQQLEITVVPGETALAFYTATNPTDNQIIGISTYNVIPFDVGQYFNKIQCFCFEEQMLNPHEQVCLPILLNNTTKEFNFIYLTKVDRMTVWLLIFFITQIIYIHLSKST